jgi:transposase-like protein
MESAENSARTDDSTQASTGGGITSGFSRRLTLADFLDEAACRQWFLEVLHPGGVRCPGCGASITDDTTLDNFWGGRRCTCKGCARWFSSTSETFLQSSCLTFRQVFLLAVLADIQGEGLDTNRIAAAVGVSANTVRIWKQRFKAING